MVKAEVCIEGEPVCNDESGDPSGPFCFVYDTCFMKLVLRLPFDLFEKEVLTEMNVCPTQLRPNSWAFLRIFFILCDILDIVPTLNVFFYFFELKTSYRKLWATLNSFSGRRLFTLFKSSYKNFKGHFIKICPSSKDPTMLEGFPLYRAPIPRFQTTCQMEDLNP